MTHRSHIGGNYDARISQLEEAISRLQKEIAEIREQSDPNRWLKYAVFAQPKRKKRGPRSKIPAGVTRLRDSLIDMLEDYWPELAPCCAKPDPKTLRSLLERVAAMPHSHNSEPARHLLENFDTLTTFLRRTDRYSGEPRQIANALAAVPYVSWWRSLKYCAARSSLSSRGTRAISDYLRRKHPEIYRCLESAGGDVLKIAVALKRVRSQDATVFLLKRNAPLAAQAWREGLQDFSRIPSNSGAKRSR